MDYRLIDFWGKLAVVTNSERKYYHCSISIDGNGTHGKVRKEIYMPAPCFMGIRGLALCGILKDFETLEEWVEKQNKKQNK